MSYIGKSKASNKVRLSIVSEKKLKPHATTILLHNKNHIFYVCLICYVRHALENLNI